MPAKSTTKEFIERARKVFGDKYDYSLVEYVNSRSKVKIIYNGKIYLQNPDDHLRNNCPEKANIRTTEDFINECNLIHDYQFDYSLVDYKNVHSMVKIIYNGKIYIQKARNHLRGCLPKELTPLSKGENKIKNILTKHSIDFIKQYKYANCIYHKELPFDFYLKDYNILIEYDGEQHYICREFFGGEKGFIERKRNDFIKTEFTKNNNIPLLRIPYFEFNNIEEIILNFIQKYKISNYNTCNTKI